MFQKQINEHLLMPKLSMKTVRALTTLILVLLGGVTATGAVRAMTAGNHQGGQWDRLLTEVQEQILSRLPARDIASFARAGPAYHHLVRHTTRLQPWNLAQQEQAEKLCGNQIQTREILRYLAHSHQELPEAADGADDDLNQQPPPPPQLWFRIHDHHQLDLAAKCLVHIDQLMDARRLPPDMRPAKIPVRLQLRRRELLSAAAHRLLDARKFRASYIYYLELNNLGLNENDFVLVAATLTSSPHMTHLDLEANQFGASGARILADALANHPGLRVLNLSENNIGDDGARFIADALMIRQRDRPDDGLQQLVLSSNEIGDVGARAISEVLMSSRSLKHLVLVMNAIGPLGAQALADALRANPIHGLEELVLGGNAIFNYGAGALASMLVVSQSLASLDLWNCGIDDDGVRAIADALTTNRSLLMLGLALNEITEESLAVDGPLSMALASNPIFGVLDLSGIDLDPAVVRTFTAAHPRLTLLNEGNEMEDNE